MHSWKKEMTSRVPASLRAFSERHFPAGSTRERLASGAYWSLLGAVVARGFTLGTSIVLARMLGKAGFGGWGLVLVAVSAFAQVAGAGMTIAASKHVAELKVTDPQRAGRSLSLIVLISTFGAIILALSCVLCAGWISESLYHEPMLLIPMRLAAFLILAMVGTQVLQGVMAGFEDFRGIARINLAHGLMTAGAAIPLTWKMGLPGAVMGVACAWTVSMALSWVATVRLSRAYGMPLGAKGIWQERRLLWSYAAPSLATSIIAAPASMLGMAIVANTPLGMRGLGGLTAALRWRDVVLFVPMSIKRVTLPILARLRGEGRDTSFLHTLLVLVGLNGGIALAVALVVGSLSPWILSLYGSEFREDWDLVVILCAAAVFQAINDVVTQVTACMDRMWWRFFIHVIWVIMLVGGAYLTVPHYGVRGYAWSLTGAVFTHMVLNSVAAAVAIRTSPSSKANQHG